MVKNKKALILLLIFLTLFNSPVYPKNRNIRYLPSDTTMDSVSKDYTSNPITLKQLAGKNCQGLFDGITACRKCAKLKDDCPDCCLTQITPTAAIHCTAGESSDYDCTEAPFEGDNCEQSKCDYTNTDDSCTNCGSRSQDDETSNSCQAEDYLDCNPDGTVASGSPYGLQRRGCPDADSDELAPAGCSNCDVDETAGINRVWTCPKTSSCTSSSSPSFETCSATSGTTTRADSASCSPYYDVTYVWAYTTTPTSTQSCNNQCNNLTCPPATLLCSPTSPNCADDTYSAIPQNCPIPCTPPCWDELVCPPASPCLPVRVCGSCTDTPCTATATCTTHPEVQSHTYSLSSTFKPCIVTCTDYADAYETCEDKITCCQESVCPESKIIKSPGFTNNCTKVRGDKDKKSVCEKRMGCINTDFCDGAITKGECIKLVRETAECLINYPVLFSEIAANDGPARYSFIARNNESLTIDWQVILESLTEAQVEKMEGVSFYTLVKVEDEDEATTTGDHISMLNIRDLDNAFSIYGLTHVPKGKLTPGKKYTVKIYYFFPETRVCQWNSSEKAYENTVEDKITLKVKQLFLNIVRVKE